MAIPALRSSRILPLSCSLLLAAFLAVPTTAPLAASHSLAEVSQWAQWVDELEIGPVDLTQPELGLASWGTEESVIGPALGDGNTCLSLGEGGSITLGFDPPIGDGPGDDFAVFENGFLGLGGLFGELAEVEVSSNGNDFARFEVESLQPSPISAFGFVFPTLYTGFAGLDPAGMGTGFDLALLSEHSLVDNGLLDLQAIGYVRVVDVVGDGLDLDDFGHAIYDPYPTPFSSSGFDLDGIGIIHLPEPTAIGLWSMGILGLFGLFRQHNRRNRLARTLPLLLLCWVGTAQAEYIVDFEDMGLGAIAAHNGSDESGQFQSGPLVFQNVYDPTWGSWSGHAASTHTDGTTGGWGNQYSAVTGQGVSGSDAYGLFYQDAYNSAEPHIILPQSEIVDGFYVTNTSYAYYSMLDGDGWAKQFGPEDWFKLTVEGFNASGVSAGILEFYLADFLTSTPGSDYILNQWTWVDTSSLGPVKELDFALSSSDVGDFGMNTPAYFAFDNIQIAPEPGTGVLVGLGLTLMALRRRS